MITRACLSVIGFTKSNNYINKNGEHPKILTTLKWNKIVLKSEELTDDNWLYIGKETEEEIKWQLESLKFCEDWIAIIE